MIHYEKLNEVDYDNKNRELHNKIDAGGQLTNEERFFVCHSLRYDNLLLYPFCIDEFFSRTFIARDSGVPPEMFIVKERDHIYYEGLVREWQAEIYKTNHVDPLMQITAKETREELKILRKLYSKFHRTFSTPEYNRRKLKLIEWSKYRYIMIKNVFEQSIKSDRYKLSFNGEEILFTYYSLTHILTRHFGHIMKTYETDKSHFTQDIHHELVHTKLEEIFKKIDDSGVYTKNSIKEINIRFNKTLYKIFTEYENIGAEKYLRLNSFFPIDHPRMLKRLNDEFEEKIVDGKLSVFISIGN